MTEAEQVVEQLVRDMDDLKRVVSAALDSRWERASDNFAQIIVNMQTLSDRIGALEDAQQIDD